MCVSLIVCTETIEKTLMKMETFGDSLKSEHFGNASFLVRASKNAILYVDR